MSGERHGRYREYIEGFKELKVKDLKSIWIEYDKQNDILYVGFGKEQAEESLLVDEDIVVGIREGYIVSITIMNFSSKAGIP